MVGKGGVQDRLERFITRHPLWVTIGFAGFLFFFSALLLAFFPSFVAILGLSLQSQAVAEPAIGTQTLLVVVVTGAVALTGLLLSIFQIRHRDQEIVLSLAQNLNRAANDAARRIFGLAKSLIKLQQSVQLLFEAFKEARGLQRSLSAGSTASPPPPSTPSSFGNYLIVSATFEGACRGLEKALVRVIKSVHEIRQDPTSLNLACEIAGGMIERFGLPDWRDRFVGNPVTEEVYRPKSAAPFNPAVFVDVLEGLEVMLFYFRDRSKILGHLVNQGETPLTRSNPANFARFFGRISVRTLTFYVLACLSCLVPWDAADSKAASKTESKDVSGGKVREQVNERTGDTHPVDQIWRGAIQAAFIDPVVTALTGDKGEKERAKVTDFLVRFLDVLRLSTNSVLSLRGMVRDFYLMANLVTKEARVKNLHQKHKKFLNLYEKVLDNLENRYYHVN